MVGPITYTTVITIDFEAEVFTGWMTFLSLTQPTESRHWRQKHWTYYQEGTKPTAVIFKGFSLGIWPTHHQHHQNACAMEARSADLVRRECPHPTAMSHSWQMEAVEPSPIWCSQVCLERPGGLLQPNRGCILVRWAYAHWRTSLAGTSVSSRATSPKRPRHREEMMSEMEDNPFLA